MKNASVIVIALAAAVAQAADTPPPVNRPVAIGDTWTFKRTVKAPTTTNQTRIIFKIAHQGAKDKYVYQSLPGQVGTRERLAWRNAGEVDMGACLVDFLGGASLGLANTCSTDLVPGMDWTTEVVEDGVRTSQRHEVIGPEDVAVGAGTFSAIKISSRWEVAGAASQSKGSAKYGAPRRYHFVYWYVPEIKSMAKVEREFRGANGNVESNVTDELQAFRVNNAE
jgi:hypothetical protein